MGCQRMLAASLACLDTRVCQLCGIGFGDEMHLVFESSALRNARTHEYERP